MSNQISNLDILNTVKKPRYSEEEDKKIADFISNNSYRNLAEAFEAFSVSALNTEKRSPGSINNRYQKHLKHNHNMFVMASSKGGMQNTKYTPREAEPDYKPVEFIAKLFLDLNRAEKNRILMILNNL